jgi:exodeoxyribonuclease V alpha subunit
MRRLMAPLFVPRRASDPPLFAELEEHLAQYYEVGVFGSTEVHVVARAIQRVWPHFMKHGRQIDGDLAVAMALAVRAPNHAHICVDLATITVAELLNTLSNEVANTAPPLPADRASWIERLATLSELVRRPMESRATPFVLDGSWLYMDRSWRYQERIVDRVAAWPPLDEVNWSDRVLTGLDVLFRPPGDVETPANQINRQRLAAAMALRNRMTVITGGPGMGKTWTVRNLLALLYLEQLDTSADVLPQIALAAPTGKAAVRIRESLLDGMQQDFIPTLKRFLPADEVAKIATFVSEIQAGTLHRLLGVKHDNTSRFRHHHDAPLPYDTVIVDEVSMVDFRMMAKLVDAIADRSSRPTRLILLGDRDQLASVEAGTVLADLCGPTTAATVRLSKAYASDLPEIAGVSGFDDVETGPSVIDWQPQGMDDRIIQFNETYRFGSDSGIKRFADACVAQPFCAEVALDALKDERSSDTRLIEYSSNGLPSEVDEIIRSQYRPYLELLQMDWRADPKRFPAESVYHRRLLDRFDAFRILCAFKRGRTGVDGMNERVTRLLATHPTKELALAPEDDFFVGKPIMVTRNDYSVGRYNGDIGIVVTKMDPLGDERLYVAFPGSDSIPSETRVQSRGHALSETEYLDLDLVEYLQMSRLPAHDTVFAMTIHKSQGSQFGHVMVVLPNQKERSPILTRELIYTGVTRASQEVTLLGSSGLLRDTLATPVQRASQLGVKLWSSS